MKWISDFDTCVVEKTKYGADAFWIGNSVLENATCKRCARQITRQTDYIKDRAGAVWIPELRAEWIRLGEAYTKLW